MVSTICGNTQTPHIPRCYQYCYGLNARFCRISYAALLISIAPNTGRFHVYIRVITTLMGTISICYPTIFYHKYPCSSHSNCKLPPPGLADSIVKPEKLKRWNHLESRYLRMNGPLRWLLHESRKGANVAGITGGEFSLINVS
jgi:hypothetical protein